MLMIAMILSILMKNWKHFVESKLSSDVTFDINPLTLTYVQNQLSTLDTAKATGLDDFSAKMLRLWIHKL